MSKPLKLLFVISSLRRCGPNIGLVNLVRNLTEEIDWKILVLNKPRGDSVFADIQSWKDRIIFAPVKWPLPKWIQNGGITGTIRAVNPDVVHSRDFLADWITAISVSRRHHIISIHNFPPDDYPLKHGRLVGTLLAKSHLLLYRRCYHLAACSSSLSARLSPLGIQAHTVPNGVDTFFFNPTANKNSRLELRKELGVSNEESLFLYVGSISDRKRVDLMCKSFNLIDPVKNKIHLCVVGAGSLLASLKSAFPNPRLHFTGPQTDVLGFYAAADAFVSLSSSEGLPNSVLEAMASGLPVFLSDIPAHRELADGLTTACLLSDANEASAIAEQWISFAASVSPGVRSPEVCDHIEREFSSRRNAERFTRIYLDVLSGHGTG